MWPCSSSFVAGVDSRCVVLVGLFELRSRPPVVPPPGSQGAAPSQVDMVSSRDTSRSGQSGCVRIMLFWPARAHPSSPFCGSAQVAPHARSRACLLLPTSRVHVWPRVRRRFLPTLCLVILRHGLQRFGFCSSCFLSPACKLGAGSSLGQAWYGTRDRQCSPYFMRIDSRGFDCVRVSIHGRASKPKRVWVFMVLTPSTPTGSHARRQPHNENASRSRHRPYLLKCMRPNVLKITQAFRAGLRQRPPGRIQNWATCQQPPL